MNLSEGVSISIGRLLLFHMLASKVLFPWMCGLMSISHKIKGNLSSQSLHFSIHFINYPFDILGGSPNCTICLESIRRCLMMLDFIFFKQLCHFFPKVTPLITYQLMWRIIPTYDVIDDEFFHIFQGNFIIESCFYPVCQVVNCHKNIFMTIGSLWCYPSTYVNLLS